MYLLEQVKHLVVTIPQRQDFDSTLEISRSISKLRCVLYKRIQVTPITDSIDGNFAE